LRFDGHLKGDGFASFFDDDSDLGQNTLLALNAIGAKECLELIAEAIQLTSDPHASASN